MHSKNGEVLGRLTEEQGGQCVCRRNALPDSAYCSTMDAVEIIRIGCSANLRPKIGTSMPAPKAAQDDAESPPRADRVES